jgi:hypothetical protein
MTFAALAKGRLIRITVFGGTTARCAHLDADPLRRASGHIGSQIAAAMGDVKPSVEGLAGEGAKVMPQRGRRMRNTARAALIAEVILGRSPPFRGRPG